MTSTTPSVSEQYTRKDLAGAILAGLRAAGKNSDALTLADLAPVDQFHIGGHDATLALLRLARLEPGAEVVDLGGGLGGPARTLALEAAVRVTVVDLTEEYLRTGEELTRWSGLAERVTFRYGDATRLPFPDGSFDAVWTQHSSMNIADKDALYREAGRVLRPGGKLAIHEIMAGAVQPVHFPVPWASHPRISFLGRPSEVRALIQSAGFRELAWNDITPEARGWWRLRPLAMSKQPTPPPLGLHLLLGPEARTIVSNVMRNLDEDRIAVIQAVFERT